MEKRVCIKGGLANIGCKKVHIHIKDRTAKEGYKTVCVKSRKLNNKIAYRKGRKLNKKYKGTYLKDGTLNEQYNKVYKKITRLQKEYLVIVMVLFKILVSMKSLATDWWMVGITIILSILLIGGHWYLWKLKDLLKGLERELDKKPGVRLNGQHYNEL